MSFPNCPPRPPSDALRPALPLSRTSYHEGWPDLRKTRMCPHVAQSARCPLSSEECKFAHSAEELRVSFDRFYKVQQCAFFDRGKCRNGDLCRFAHGEHELRGGASISGSNVGSAKNSSSAPRVPTPQATSISSSTPKEASLSSVSTRGEPQDGGDIGGEERRKAGDLALFLSAQRRGQQRRHHSRRRSCEAAEATLQQPPQKDEQIPPGMGGAGMTPLAGSIDNNGNPRNSQGGASTAAGDSPSDLVSLYSRSSSAEERPDITGFTPFPHTPQRMLRGCQEARETLERCSRLPWQEQHAFASAQTAVLTTLYQD